MLLTFVMQEFPLLVFTIPVIQLLIQTFQPFRVVLIALFLSQPSFVTTIPLTEPRVFAILLNQPGVFAVLLIQLGVFVVLLTQPRVFADHDPLTQPGVFDSLITLL